MKTPEQRDPERAAIVHTIIFLVVLTGMTVCLLLMMGCAHYSEQRADGSRTTVTVLAIGNRHVTATPTGATVTVTSSPETIGALGTAAGNAAKTMVRP